MSYYCSILQPCVKQWLHIGGQSNSDANKDTAESEAFEKSRPTDRDWSREQSGRRKRRKEEQRKWTMNEFPEKGSDAAAAATKKTVSRGCFH